MTTTRSQSTPAAHERTDGVPAPRLRAAVAGSLVAKTLEVATLVLLATLVPRALGPADFGRFSVLLTIVTLGSLALTLGGPTLMARFVPAAPPHERVALARAIGARLTRGRAAQLLAIALAAIVGLARSARRKCRRSSAHSCSAPSR